MLSDTCAYSIRSPSLSNPHCVKDAASIPIARQTSDSSVALRSQTSVFTLRCTHMLRISVLLLFARQYLVFCIFFFHILTSIKKFLPSHPLIGGF